MSRHIEDPEHFSEQFIQTYLRIFTNIQQCSGILRDILHTEVYSGIIEAYGAIIRLIRNSA